MAVETTTPNKPDAANPAIASRFQIGHHWRGVGEPDLVAAMKHQSTLVAISYLAFLALLLLGFWVGAFESFGGYLPRKRAFLWGSLAIGLLVALLLNRGCKVHYALAGAFFVLSHFIYVLGQACGQTYYVGPRDAGDFVRTLLLALNNQL